MQVVEPKVHIIVEKGNDILFLLRKSTGCYDGYWSLPTGRVELNEPPTVAAKRELLEETGLDLSLKFISTLYAKVPNVLDPSQPDYIDLCFFFGAKLQKIEPVNKEPDIHAELNWFSPLCLPEKLIPTSYWGVQSFLKSQAYTEFGWSLNLSKKRD